MNGSGPMNWTECFLEAVRHSFAFLEAMGFEPSSERSGNYYAAVTYTDSSGQTVSVGACPARCDLEATIISPNDETTSLGELVDIFPQPNLPTLDYGILEALGDAAKLQYNINCLAKRFQLAAVPLLTGEASWQQVTDWRERKQRRAQSAQIMRRLETAFKEHRWADVLTPASELSADADSLALKRAEYARKQLALE